MRCTGPAARLEVVDDLADGRGRQQAEVCCTRGGLGCVWRPFTTQLMQIDFLIPEVQCAPLLPELLHGHAEHAAIEATSGVNVAHGEHDVIDRANVHAD